MSHQLPKASSDSLLVAFVRHGQTESNKHRRFLGHRDEPLNAMGEEQIKGLRAMHVGAVYSSPLRRALQTASVLGDAIILPDLVELDQGELDGLTFEEALGKYSAFFRTWIRTPERAQIPGGETLSTGQKRFSCCVENAVKAHAMGDCIAIVSHKMVLGLFWAHMKGLGVGRWKEGSLSNAGVGWARYRGGQWEVLSWG